MLADGVPHGILLRKLASYSASQISYSWTWWPLLGGEGMAG